VVGDVRKMSEFNQPQQTPENTEHIGFMARALHFAQDTYYAAADRVEDVADRVRSEAYDYRRPAALGVVLALGGLAGGLKGETSLAQESVAQPVPNAWDIIVAERAKAIAENPDMQFRGPEESQIAEYQIPGAAGYSAWDDLDRVTITRAKKSKLKVNVNLENRRGLVQIANFQSQEDLGGDRIKKYYVTFDGDMFSKSSVVATPMLRPESGGKPRKWGDSVVLPGRETAPENMSKVQINGYTQSDGKYSRTVNVKPKKLTSELVESGRLYVDITQQCAMKDLSYNPDNSSCDKTLGRTFRVKPKQKTSYIPGRPSKPGDVYVYQKKAN
jgi:hypothetical protein